MTTEYQKWVEWAQKNDNTLKPLTRSQVEIAEYVLSNKELVAMLEQPGDKITIIKQIQHYLKNKPLEKEIQ